MLVALGLDTRRAGPVAYDPRPLPRGVEAEVLAACREDPRTLDEIVVGLDLPIAEAAMALARLERTGWVREAGGWFEPVVSRSRATMREYPPGGCPARAPPSDPCPTSRAEARPTTSSPAWSIDSFARSLSSLSDHTVAAYASDVRGFATWAARAGIEQPAAVKRTNLRRYLAFLTTRQYARRSVARKAAALRRYFQWLVRAGHLDADPTVGLQARGGDGRLPRVLERRDLDRAAGGCPPRGRAGLAPPPRRRGARGALRLGPAGQRAVRPGRRLARPRRGRGRVWGKGAKQRRVPLSAPAVAALRSWLGVRHEVLVTDGGPARRPGCSATSGAAR